MGSDCGSSSGPCSSSLATTPTPKEIPTLRKQGFTSSARTGPGGGRPSTRDPILRRGSPGARRRLRDPLVQRGDVPARRGGGQHEPGHGDQTHLSSHTTANALKAREDPHASPRLCGGRPRVGGDSPDHADKRPPPACCRARWGGGTGSGWPKSGSSARRPPPPASGSAAWRRGRSTPRLDRECRRTGRADGVRPRPPTTGWAAAAGRCRGRRHVGRPWPRRCSTPGAAG
jgi:hypothetical protein